MCTGYSSNDDELEIVLSVIDVNLLLSIEEEAFYLQERALLVPSDIWIDQYYPCSTPPGYCVK